MKKLLILLLILCLSMVALYFILIKFNTGISNSQISEHKSVATYTKYKAEKVLLMSKIGEDLFTFDLKTDSLMPLEGARHGRYKIIYSPNGRILLSSTGSILDIQNNKSIVFKTSAWQASHKDLYYLDSNDLKAHFITTLGDSRYDIAWIDDDYFVVYPNGEVSHNCNPFILSQYKKYDTSFNEYEINEQDALNIVSNKFLRNSGYTFISKTQMKNLDTQKVIELGFSLEHLDGQMWSLIPEFISADKKYIAIPTGPQDYPKPMQMNVYDLEASNKAEKLIKLFSYGFNPSANLGDKMFWFENNNIYISVEDQQNYHTHTVACNMEGKCNYDDSVSRTDFAQYLEAKNPYGDGVAYKINRNENAKYDLQYWFTLDGTTHMPKDNDLNGYQFVGWVY